MNSDRSEQLGQGSIPGLLLRFSAPAIVGTVAQAMYNVIDTIFVSRAIGVEGIAGTTVSLPPMVLVLRHSFILG
jgi:Na+-driven multidrug efflux pump